MAAHIAVPVCFWFHQLIKVCFFNKNKNTKISLDSLQQHQKGLSFE
jgi:hypothetical protein